jgi:molecular chaperone DnaK
VDIHFLQGEREMAMDNKTIGRFQLTGIPPAPRGMPQIEVTFDIDANGIMHVSAKDKATGKEQSIRIEASSGLSREEIDRMVHDAEAHRDEDVKRRERVEIRNQAEQMAYMTEKQLGEEEDKLSAEARGDVETALADLQEELKGESSDAIKSASDKLEQAWHKAAQELYQQAAAEQQAQEQAQEQSAGGGEGEQAPSDEDAVDADYEVMDDEE